MIKDAILDQLLVDWSTMSLFPHIARDVTMGGVVTKEQAINHAQYLELVYSQSDTHYDLIPHGPQSLNDPSKTTPEAHVDGMIGSMKLQPVTQSIGKQGHQASTPASF